jgi:ketosteroid isomerase-like protein
VRGRVNQWARAVNNRAYDTLATLYHHGPELVVITSDGRRLDGWEAVDAANRAQAESPAFNFLVRDVTVDVVSEEVAVSNFRTSLDVETGRGRQVTAGFSTLVWIREADGRPWTIRAEHHSTAAAEP